MMTIDVLEGAWLDAWVALAQGHDGIEIGKTPGGQGLACRSRPPGAGDACLFCPTCDWTQATPIIEREHILLRDREPWTAPPRFEAMLQHRHITWFAEGPLPLVAAMRVYVRSRFDEQQLQVPPFGPRDAPGGLH